MMSLVAESKIAQAGAIQHMSQGEPPPARKFLPAVGAMKFWATIFRKSMESFKETYEQPKPRTIEKRTYCIRGKTDWLGVYDELEAARQVWKGKGFMRDVKKGMRAVLERVQVLRQPIILGSDIEFVSPVFAAIQIIADAAKEVSKVRAEVSVASGNDLEEKFGLIEQFLAIFENDEVVEGASVSLIASILKAVEDVIGYYTKNMLLKGGAALLRGEDYYKDLKESLDRINSSCDSLILQAKTSDMYRTRQLWNKVDKGYSELMAEQKKLTQDQQVMKDNTQEILEYQKREATKLNEVLGLLEGYQRNLDQHQKLLQRDGQINALNKQIAYFSPRDMDALDIGRWTPSPQLQLAPVVWITQHELRTLLGVLDLDEIDSKYIIQRGGQYPDNHRARVEQLVTTAQFREWVGTTTSHILLIHGDFGEPSKHYVSALSLFCTTLVEALKRMTGFLTLIFFCGRHLDTRDGPTGGEGIIKSLVAQLLRQQNFDTRQLHQEIDLNKLNNGDIDELCVLFRWLVRRVPENVTLFCLIDGIILYERSDYEYTMGQVLAYLLDLTRDLSIRSILKFLITSPVVTAKVRQHPAFYTGKNILSMATISPLGQGSSEARLARQLGDNLGEFRPRGLRRGL